LEADKKNEIAERSKFYEGAAWMGKQVVNECEQGIKATCQLKNEF